jgi:ring-1,2-phenylacetyl-CoA epoxidase subunit PaaC
VRLAAIAAKSLKETRYHFRYSSGWLVRLGDSTDESHLRAQRALDDLWRFTTELFTPDAIDAQIAAAGVAPAVESLAAGWSTNIGDVLAEAKLRRPADVPYSWHGKRGEHSEHLGYLLAEMQSLQRAHPGAQW